MKISKIPGLGRFGAFIDDVDLATVSNEEWLEIGKIHLETLVTIIRCPKPDPETYAKKMALWGESRNVTLYRVLKKYGLPGFEELANCVKKNDPRIEADDARWVRDILNMVYHDSRGHPTRLLRVSGKRNENNEPIGMFADGELLWHSNESGILTFTPGVALLGYEGVVGSSTGFLTTTDWYEAQSESFRKELDEMVLIHKFTPGRISPGVSEEQDFVVYKNMCPVNDSRIPMVIQSPSGIRGLHYSINTVDRIEGMSKGASDSLIKKITNELFVDKYIYDHWYQKDGDICLFDNSITLHRRLGSTANRLGYRIQYDYSNLQDRPYQPYFQKEFQDAYNREIREQVRVLNLSDFKMPKRSWRSFLGL